MRFGFKLPHQGTTWSALADVWRAGDDLTAFESGWTYDHLATAQADPNAAGGIALAPEIAMLDGWSLLAALAATTSRLRLGNLVTCAAFRHPVVLTKMATTIDQISGGRLELGLGAGWLEPEAAMYGTDLGTVKDRLDRLNEALEVITALLKEDAVDYDGRFYKLRGARVEPKPQERRLPIWLGGNGERRTLRLVARYADAWNYTALRPGGELDAFTAKCAVLRERCAEIGRDPSEIVVSAQVPYAGTASASVEAAAAWRAAGASYVIFMLPAGAPAALLTDLGDALEPLLDD